MSSSKPSLDEVLRDCDLLCSALGLENPTASAMCPFCKAPYGLKLWEASGYWKWTCSNKTCAGYQHSAGTVIEALMLADKKTRAEVIGELTDSVAEMPPANLVDEEQVAMEAGPEETTEESEVELPAEAAAISPAQTEQAQEPAETQPPEYERTSSNDRRKSDDELLRIKQDGAAIRQALGIDKDGNHCQCPLCGDKTSLRCGPSKDGSGVYVCQCMKGCLQGTVIDVVMALERIPKERVRDAIKIVKDRFGTQNKSHKPEPAPAAVIKPGKKSNERDDPVLDHERADQFTNYAHSELIKREELQDKWLGKRHISLQTAIKFKLGFIEKGTIPILGKKGNPNWNWHCENFWVFRITDEHGVLKGVKVHFETPPPGDFKGKSLWVNFGLDPKHDSASNTMPRCAYYTLWPHIEHQPRELKIADETSIEYYLKQASQETRARFKEIAEINCMELAHQDVVSRENLSPEREYEARVTAFNHLRSTIQEEMVKGDAFSKGDIFVPTLREYVVICGGELKAFAAISAGFVATSVTGGESALPESRHFRCFRGKDVLLALDDDPAKKVETPHGHHLTCAGRGFGFHVLQMLKKHNARRVISKAMGRNP